MSEESLKTAKGTAREWLAWRDDEESGIDHEGHVSSLAGLLLDEIAAAHRRGWDEAVRAAAKVCDAREDERHAYEATPLDIVADEILSMPYLGDSK